MRHRHRGRGWTQTGGTLRLSILGYQLRDGGERRCSVPWSPARRGARPMYLRCLSRLALHCSSAVLAASVACTELGAQGVTTAAIEGRVRDERQSDVDGALVRAVNRATGYGVEVLVRGGRYALLGLEVGGPYLVIVRRIGYYPVEHDNIFLTLGQRLRLDVLLDPVGTFRDTVRVIAVTDPAFSRSRTGAGTTISDTTLHRLPARNRDLYDFAQLAPQVSSRQGISGGGVGPRLNSFLVDGVSERALQGNNAAGAASGGKAIPIEAVKEYQVLLSPYDARNGDFAGALVNAVTKRGTTSVKGTAFVYASNEALARNVPFLRDAPYHRAQFGFTLGGPVVRDRAHYFVATEFQRLTAPARGTYVGRSTASGARVPASDSVARFTDILRTYGLEAGSAGQVEVGNPLVNLFGRLDVTLPEWHSRIVLRHNYGRTRDIRFSRDDSAAAFPLSSYGLTQTLTKQALAAQIYTNLRHGALNELLVGFTSVPSVWTPNASGPLVVVGVQRATGRDTTLLRAGSNELAQGISLRQESAEIADHLTVPLGGPHRLALGVRAELFRIRRGGLAGSYGSWSFANLDSLQRGAAERYVLTRDFGGAEAQLRGAQLDVYANDERQVTDHLSLTFGLRADVVALADHPPDNRLVDSVFGRRTSAVPSMLVSWSPRFGFNWNVTGDRRSQVRGGVGIFAGRPPLGWLHAAVYNYGSGVGTLQCGTLRTDAGPAPRFVADYRNPPTSCAGGGGFTSGPVNLVSRNLRMGETLRASLGYDRMLPWSVVATLEGMYGRSLSDFLFVNLNLAGTDDVDRHGRVLYGEIRPDGRATQKRVSNSFSEVIDLRSQSKNHSMQLSARLDRRFSDRLEASASYAYSRVRDVQTPPSGFQANVNWQTGRVVSGRHGDVAATTSALEIPHRAVVVGTYTAPWRRWVTDVSIYYVGEAGAPFTYLASVRSGRGDLNADGTNANDPIYVPRNASDTSEILFDGEADQELGTQQVAFQRLIAGTECLRRQRGRIMARNSCRGPWTHVTNASVRQSLPAVRGHAFALQLDVFNVLNLLDEDWGHVRVPNVALLEQVGQTPGVPAVAQPIFRYDPARPRFNSQNIESSYQLQLGLRYSF
ncbi:MAG TPA: TonB-dependent receptor [Gemmatimonadaceae bacterium]|nr:TonB-dependent receptor [Gemmatimonadaceae bacterium]